MIRLVSSNQIDINHASVIKIEQVGKPVHLAHNQIKIKLILARAGEYIKDALIVDNTDQLEQFKNTAAVDLTSPKAIDRLLTAVVWRNQERDSWNIKLAPLTDSSRLDGNTSFRARKIVHVDTTDMVSNVRFELPGHTITPWIPLSQVERMVYRRKDQNGAYSRYRQRYAHFKSYADAERAVRDYLCGSWIAYNDQADNPAMAIQSILQFFM